MVSVNETYDTMLTPKQVYTTKYGGFNSLYFIIFKITLYGR